MTLNKVLDEIQTLRYKDKIIIVLDNKIENITENFDHVQLTIQNNQIILLGPKIAQTLTNKLSPSVDFLNLGGIQDILGIYSWYCA